MGNHDFVPLLILKYWFYMVRFVSKTIIKTKREKNHSIQDPQYAKPSLCTIAYLHFVHTFGLDFGTGTWLPSPAATPDESTWAGTSIQGLRLSA